MSKVSIKTSYKGNELKTDIEIPWIIQNLFGLSGQIKDTVKSAISDLEGQPEQTEEDEPEMKKLDVKHSGRFFCDRDHCRFWSQTKKGMAIHKGRVHR